MILNGPELEQALAAVFCCCGFEIDWDVVEQIKFDSLENHVDPKQYVLHDSSRALLVATVDAYEPETVELCLQRGICKHFDPIVAAASAMGFGCQAYFLDFSIDTPNFIVSALDATHGAAGESFARVRLVALAGVEAITRCFVANSRIKPTPYIVYATDLRTLQSRQLSGEEAAPFRIRGYR